MVNDAHWPTDGEWKESVLRSMLRRSAPESVTVGRGFVVHLDKCSTQIDVLIYDNSMPILYRDGDLVFVTPSACRGIVEVKSNTDMGNFRAAAKKLSDNAEFIRSRSFDFHLFVGFFSFDVRTENCRPFLNALNDAAEGQDTRLIDHVILGSNKLIKYWSSDPSNPGASPRYNQWHLYNLNRMAPGYFIHNLLLSVSKKLDAQREETWFPINSKEAHIEAQHVFERVEQQTLPADVSRSGEICNEDSSTCN
ncbi:hypothetical protein RIE95_02190 [Acidithiobacillus thiooxidans]|uniref:DUF6602 domain-containing protein n=1 Tax=Acidithiobacillus thiooxidans TaxID=930 RepID=UPI002859453C|nr:DUF6602 domain-containing protein [Acidithiobacillus thiooxidans]MDR7925815.1 hypothetical protein [Acidithiobacillus thiooxidans]